MPLTPEQVARLDRELEALTPTHPVDLTDIDAVSKIVRAVIGKPWLLDVHHRVRELVIEIREPGSAEPIYERVQPVQSAPANKHPPARQYRRSGVRHRNEKKGLY